MAKTIGWIVGVLALVVISGFVSVWWFCPDPDTTRTQTTAATAAPETETQAANDGASASQMQPQIHYHLPGLPTTPQAPVVTNQQPQVLTQVPAYVYQGPPAGHPGAVVGYVNTDRPYIPRYITPDPNRARDALLPGTFTDEQGRNHDTLDALPVRNFAPYINQVQNPPTQPAPEATPPAGQPPATGQAQQPAAGAAPAQQQPAAAQPAAPTGTAPAAPNATTPPAKQVSSATPPTNKVPPYEVGPTVGGTQTITIKAEQADSAKK